MTNLSTQLCEKAGFTLANPERDPIETVTKVVPNLGIVHSLLFYQGKEDYVLYTLVENGEVFTPVNIYEFEYHNWWTPFEQTKAIENAMVQAVIWKGLVH